MKRISLVPLAAALLLGNPVTCSAQNLPANELAWVRAVNLMPLIDPEKDAVSGIWKIVRGTLVSSAGTYVKIQIPYEPPDEYDFRIVFVRTGGNGDVKQIVSRVQHAMAWTMGAGENGQFGFGVVRGINLGSNATTVKLKAGLAYGRVITSIVQVRRQGAKAYVDGKLISQVESDFSDLTLSRGWDMPDHRLLGVGSYGGITEFQKIELLEIAGKGRVVPRTEIAKVAPRPQPAKPPTKSPTRVTTTENTGRTTTVSRPADPELQKNARPLLRNQSSIKALFVMGLASGQRVGGVQDIIATAEYGRSGYETVCKFATTVGSDTRISMDEAVHLVKVRYPIWKAGHEVRFSYSEKYSRQAGGSAGAAFSVLLLSLLEDFGIDPDFAITGDVTVDGKIREVGAVSEKLRGAMLEKCKIVSIPLANKENLSDLAILYTPAMLWSMQILSASTIDEASILAHKERPEKLAKAIALFSQLQTGMGATMSLTALRGPGMMQALQQVLQLAPNHLSAEFMLRAARGQLPVVLSLSASLEETWAASTPVLRYLFSENQPDAKKGHTYRVEKLPAETLKLAQDRLTWLDMRLHPKTKDLKAAMTDYINSLDSMRRQSGVSTKAYQDHLAKRDKVIGEITKIGTDRKTLEEMLH